jgi:hypothetical protein
VCGVNQVDVVDQCSAEIIFLCDAVFLKLSTTTTTTTTQKKMSEGPTTLQSSRAEVWDLKGISFGAGESKRNIKIITQNFNGFVRSLSYS